MTVTKPSFVYTTYINSTPDKVFAAIQDPEMTRRYWGHHRNQSDWKPGSRWEHQDYEDAGVVHIVGKVVESDPPRRLVISWAAPGSEADPEKTSRVTFEIVPYCDYTKLTVLHEELEPESEMQGGITEGWPAVLSSLKTLLETGQPLPGTDQPWKR